MSAKQLLDQGRLADAVSLLASDVAARPDDLMSQTFFFEVLAFNGEFDRAESALETIERLDDRTVAQTGVNVYRTLLAAERARDLVFREARTPNFLTEKSPTINLHLEALEHFCRGQMSIAREALDRAQALEQPRNVTAGGVTTQGIRDCDDLLAPFLEVITSQGYFWVPWADIQLLIVPPPRDLRDLLWVPARIATNIGMLGEVYLPNLYPGSAKDADEAVRLGHATHWDDAGGGIIRGRGTKMFAAGDEPRTLHEFGQIQLTPLEATDLELDLDGADIPTG
jgi:type VI secretion system protein ImpE